MKTTKTKECAGSGFYDDRAQARRPDDEEGMRQIDWVGGDVGSETNVHFSSATDEWATPKDVYRDLHREFGFSLDPCSDGTNQKTARHFTKSDDGLTQPWAPETVFMNPPYSEIDKWIRKAWEESQKGAIVVALIPSRTDTRWWHSYCMRAREIRFIRGRLKFGDAVNSAPFPSAIVIFERKPGGQTMKRG